MNFGQSVGNLLKILFRSDGVQIIVHDAPKKTEKLKCKVVIFEAGSQERTHHEDNPHCANIYISPNKKSSVKTQTITQYVSEFFK